MLKKLLGPQMYMKVEWKEKLTKNHLHYTCISIISLW